MVRAAGAGVIYTLLAFAAGIVLGTVRELALVPLWGKLAATLIEAPLMLAVSYVAAWFVIGWRKVENNHLERALMGGVALLVLLGFEFAGDMIFRGLDLAGALARMSTPAGMVGMALFLIFAAMPLAVSRRGN